MEKTTRVNIIARVAPETRHALKLKVLKDKRYETVQGFLAAKVEEYLNETPENPKTPDGNPYY